MAARLRPADEEEAEPPIIAPLILFLHRGDKGLMTPNCASLKHSCGQWEPSDVGSSFRDSLDFPRKAKKLSFLELTCLGFKIRT